MNLDPIADKGVGGPKSKRNFRRPLWMAHRQLDIRFRGRALMMSPFICISPSRRLQKNFGFSRPLSTDVISLSHLAVSLPC